MVNTFLVQFIILAALFCGQGWAKMDRFHSEAYLGEKRLDSYSNRWQPLVSFDLYQGKLSFQDELFFQNYFQQYMFSAEGEFSHFFKSEISGGLNCSNDMLSAHFDELRYSYRLIALSYLLESQWHSQMASKHFRFNRGCKFDFEKWLENCRPHGVEMKKFVSLLKKYRPQYEELLPKDYTKTNWWNDFLKKDFKYYSHYRLDKACHGKCSQETIEASFQNVCVEDEKLMSLICSEADDVYGLSYAPDAYNLLAYSNIINTYNKQGEALGCLRRFSSVMAHKEVRYPSLTSLFHTMRVHLSHQYQERFLQGRVFFYGSGKEFEEKGLTNLYVMEQPLKIAQLDSFELVKPVAIPKKLEPTKTVVSKPMKSQAIVANKELINILKPTKSAFLQASDMRKAQDLDRVEVDMLKLKFDHVFTLNMINKLSGELKTFMTWEALSEMKTFDKLGTKEGPVPLLFLKFMIDMEEYTGLYNILNVLGDEFYVSNEIDIDFKPEIERIKLSNSESNGRVCQMYVLIP